MVTLRIGGMVAEVVRLSVTGINSPRLRSRPPAKVHRIPNPPWAPALAPLTAGRTCGGLISERTHIRGGDAQNMAAGIREYT